MDFWSLISIIVSFLGILSFLMNDTALLKNIPISGKFWSNYFGVQDLIVSGNLFSLMIGPIPANPISGYLALPIQLVVDAQDQ